MRAHLHRPAQAAWRFGADQRDHRHGRLAGRPGKLLVVAHVGIIEDEVSSDRLGRKLWPGLARLKPDDAELADKTLNRGMRPVQDPSRGAAEVFRPDARHFTTFSMEPSGEDWERCVRYGSARSAGRRLISRKRLFSSRAMMAGWAACRCAGSIRGV